MRVHVVSDVHGNVEALARAGDGADALIVLGDLIDFVDYHDHRGGIFGAIFGAEAVRAFATLRSSGSLGQAGAYVRELWSTLDDAERIVDEALREQYQRIFEVLPAPTYATPGNVDAPHLWPEFETEGLHILDGATTMLGDLRLGMVGGMVVPRRFQAPNIGAWQPYLRDPGEFATALKGIAGSDVIASHIPPAVAELGYDVIARRPESVSADLLEMIRRDRPRIALFGHVHQPLASRTRVGRTECVNVGHFQRSGVPFVIEW